MKLTVVLACAAAALSIAGCGTNSTQPASNAHHFERPYTLRFYEVQQLDSETIRLCGCDDVGIEFCKRYPVEQLTGLLDSSDDTLSCAKPEYALEG